MDRHFNINPYYIPIYNTVDPTEDEMRYYRRSRHLIDSLVEAHKYQGGTILLSGHAGSIESLTRGIVRRRARPERLLSEAYKVNYCNFTILERDASTGQWFVHLPITSENPYGGQRTIESSIPLYSPSSQYVLSNHFRGSSFPLRSHSYGDALYRYRYR
jgi:hypothetical protein